jgi:hypothetical protein
LNVSGTPAVELRPPADEHNVEGTVTDDGIRDADVAALRESHIGWLHTQGYSTLGRVALPKDLCPLVAGILWGA